MFLLFLASTCRDKETFSRQVGQLSGLQIQPIRHSLWNECPHERVLVGFSKSLPMSFGRLSKQIAHLSTSMSSFLLDLEQDLFFQVSLFGRYWNAFCFFLLFDELGSSTFCWKGSWAVSYLCSFCSFSRAFLFLWYCFFRFCFRCLCVAARFVTSDLLSNSLSSISSISQIRLL